MANPAGTSDPTDRDALTNDQVGGTTDPTSNNNTLDPVRETPKPSLTLDPLVMFAQMQQLTLQMHQANVEAQQAAEARARAAQEAAELWAHEDAERFARLEEVLIRTATRPVTPPTETTLDGRRIDLQRFRTSDGPVFVGPYHKIKPFLTWIHGVQIFFDTKGVLNDDDKVCLTGTMIKETNLLSVYSNKAKNYIGKTWKEFKEALFQAALPLRWRFELKAKIRLLKMGDLETFTSFETRARTLQRMINFDCDPPEVSDKDLAQWITLGLTTELHADVVRFELLEATPFDYARFTKRVRGFAAVLPARPPPRRNPTNPGTSETIKAETRFGGLSRDEFFWRIHAYLDSVGRCHFCKQHCGSTAGNCPGPLNRTRVVVPGTFVTPPKPPNYMIPKAWNSPSGPSTKPTLSAAGRATSRPAGVAGVESSEDDLFPALDVASAEAMEELDG
ncbi:hypothetical protein PTTG_30487 [Puccinia triticina 1-1 BBBD Race 1]|uniref:Retrotransposon gag domain-containing protein n=1 Tax=Puccinia triticina (isolate 1-1 / race 1 (BBBD)) TaxID=630390 RepID=A0A180FYK4_PUCT1|nr:hypothetical protein PTTG_30487 [Puccinia triticina 1-1 BBBD Race 1]